MVELASILIALLSGLANGMVLFLAAIGLTIIFGVLGVLNFAHGSLYMMGAYGMVLLFQAEGSLGVFAGNFWPLLVVAPLIVALVGGVMERFVIRQIYDHDHEFQLLLTFALVLILDNGVRIIYGARPKSMPVPTELQFSFGVLGKSFPAYNVFLIAVGGIVIALLWSLFNFTRFGRRVRAAAQDREMADAHGVNVLGLFTVVFFIGSFLAGLGGALAAPYQSVTPALGETIIIESFIIVVIGGLGSFRGALVASLLIGIINSVAFLVLPTLEPYIPFVLMAAVLLVRPEGLFAGGEPA